MPCLRPPSALTSRRGGGPQPAIARPAQSSYRTSPTGALGAWPTATRSGSKHMERALPGSLERVKTSAQLVELVVGTREMPAMSQDCNL